MGTQNRSVTLREIHYREYLNRENNFRHASYDKDQEQYDLLRRGDPRAADIADARFREPYRSQMLSDDALRSQKYMFVAAAALASRTAVQAGVGYELAFNASDLYIQKADQCETAEELFALVRDMFLFYAKQVAAQEKKNIYAKPVIQCMDYIYYHLNEKIRLQDLAKAVGRNPTYLSELFKKETGYTLSDYILNRRIETACNMLRYSDYSFVEISTILAFSSQSHFIQVFKKKLGMTPREYRTRFYRP